jgi:diguanylate cyclase (GGDEF)-like protein
MLINSSGVEGAQILLERIRQSIMAMRIEFEDLVISVTNSAGVCNIKKEDDMETVIAHADKALYKAKRDGRNRTVFYEGASA